MNYDETIQYLSRSKSNLRCQEVCNILTDLGFTVKSGKSFNHKGFSHRAIKHFYGGTFNCGHGKNPQINQRYIENILNILKKYKQEIKNYLEDSDHI